MQLRREEPSPSSLRPVHTIYSTNVVIYVFVSCPQVIPIHSLTRPYQCQSLGEGLFSVPTGMAQAFVYDGRTELKRTRFHFINSPHCVHAIIVRCFIFSQTEPCIRSWTLGNLHRSPSLPSSLHPPLQSVHTKCSGCHEAASFSGSDLCKFLYR